MRENVKARKVLVVGLFLVILSPLFLRGQTAHAAPAMDTGESSLVDELHRQGILTDEKYAELKKRESRIDKVVDFLGDFRFGMLTFLDYSYGEQTVQVPEYVQGQPVLNQKHETRNRFTVTRGYIDIQKSLTSWMSLRATPDVYQSDAGDFNLRMKYLYAEFLPPHLLFLTNMKAQVGIEPTPWLSFEESINPYRCQGTMFLERAGIFTSADVGVGIQGFWGGRLQGATGGEESGYYAGRWGSWHVGVYNGSGYHATEENNNKVPEYRVTVRPLPDIAPGLQLSYFGLYGEGNQRTTTGGWPGYEVNLGMLSYQDAWIILTGQYARVVGNSSGTLIVPGTDKALRAQGFSFFFNTKVPGILDRRLNLFARYDYFDPDIKGWVTNGDDAYRLFMAGLAWQFYGRCLLLVDYERVTFDKNSGGVGMPPLANLNLEPDWKTQLVLQIGL